MRNLCGNLVEKFVSDQSVEWIERGVPGMDEVEKKDGISGSLVKQVISRQCSARLSAMKVWYIIENRACAAIVHSFSKPRKTYECMYTNTYTSKLSRGGDKPSPKLLGQDKPRLELAVVE